MKFKVGDIIEYIGACSLDRKSYDRTGPMKVIAVSENLSYYRTKWQSSEDCYFYSSRETAHRFILYKAKVSNLPTEDV